MNYTTLFEYKQGQYQRGAEHVAEKLHELGIDSSEYLWADVHNNDMSHAIVIWQKSQGTSIPPRDIFDMSDDEESDIDVYIAGYSQSEDFDAEYACDSIYGPPEEDIEGEIEGYQSILADIKERTREIIATGDFWCQEFEGETIPPYTPPDNDDD